MIMTVKIKRKKIALFCLGFLILTNVLSWAGGIYFTDCQTRTLKVLEVNIEAQTAVLESTDGVAATLSVGDVVGQEGTTIIEITKLLIILEGLSLIHI